MKTSAYSHLVSQFINPILIFITIIILLVFMQLSLESKDRTLDKSLSIENLKFRFANLSQLKSDSNAFNTALENFNREVTNNLESIKAQHSSISDAIEQIEESINSSVSGYHEANKGSDYKSYEEQIQADLNQLSDVYTRFVSEKSEAVNFLFYLLVMTFFIQFIMLLLSILKILKSREKHLHSQLLIQSLQLARESERTKISSYLHDSILQELAYFQMKSDISEEESRTLRSVTEKIRNLCYSLTPLHLNTIGLEESVKQLIFDIGVKKDYNISLNFRGYDDSAVNDNERLVLYRVIQESLNNIIKHSKADEVQILVNFTQIRLTVTIKDNGQGFDSSNSILGKHYGLSLMKEMAKSVNFDLSINSTIGKGTTIKAIKIF